MQRPEVGRGLRVTFDFSREPEPLGVGVAAIRERVESDYTPRVGVRTGLGGLVTVLMWGADVTRGKVAVDKDRCDGRMEPTGVDSHISIPLKLDGKQVRFGRKSESLP